MIKYLINFPLLVSHHVKDKPPMFYHLHNEDVAANFIENKGIIVNKNTIEVSCRRKRFIIHRLNNIRFRNAKRYPFNRRDVW